MVSDSDRETTASDRLVRQYQPDPEEEAWHASPDGKLALARTLRAEAQRMIERAQALEAEAEGMRDAGWEPPDAR